MVEPSDVQSQHLSLASSDVADDEVAMDPLNLGLSDLDFGSIICKHGGLPCLFRQVVSNYGNAVVSVCLRNDDLRAKLVLAKLETIPIPNLDSLGVDTILPVQSGLLLLKGGSRLLCQILFLLLFHPRLRSCDGENVNVDKGIGVVFVEMDGCDVGGVDRSGPLLNVTLSCFDM